MRGMIRMVAAVVMVGLGGASAGVAWGADVHVSAAGGMDRYSGGMAMPAADGSDGPVATLGRAKERVREIREAEPGRQEPVVVEVAEGIYELEETLRLGPEDSGTEASPVVYRAREGARPVISGGRVIEGWDVDGHGWWRVTLDDAEAGAWAFSQLFVDGQRRYRPRLPREGYLTIERELEPTEEHADRGHDRFGYAAGEIPDDLARPDELEVLAFHTWSASRMRIDAWDKDERVVTFTGPTRTLNHWGAFREGFRYLVDNVREELGEAGDWYLDVETGELTYVPKEGEEPGDVRVVAPRLEQIVRLEGEAGAEVKHVRFEGLTFAHANWNLPAEGQSYPQAEVHLEGAVYAEGAREVVFKRCAVRHVGGYAMEIGRDSRDVRIERCEMIDMAAGGVKVGHDAERVTVRDSTIAHGGRMHPAGVGVWIGHGADHVIEHNDIFDFYYTGISVGWTWGYREPSQSHGHTIASNHIHTIGQRVLSDMGGVYTLGRQPGTSVSHNVIHDVMSYDYGGWGLYPDEGTTDMVMRNNLVYRTRTGGFHQHYGRENVVENNIFVNQKLRQIERTRTEEHISFFFRRNIVYWEGEGELLGINFRDDNFVMDRNVYYHPEREVRFWDGASLKQWRERGHDRESVVADPMFVDVANEDFRLREDSPAFELGFEEFDYEAAGRVTDRKLTPGLPEVPAGFEGVRR